MDEKVHLDRGRLERLWEELRGDLRAEAGPLRAEAEHVSSCALCRREWEMLREAARDLRPLPPMANHEPGPGCPGEGDLRRVAAGLRASGDADGDALLQHAAQCDHCGAILREGVTSFSNAVTAEEESAVAALGSSQPQWQREIALRMSAHSHRAARAESGSGVEGQYFIVSKFPVWVLAAAAVVLIALAGGGIALWRMNRAPDVNALLAQAYTEQRPMELRIPGAAHGPIRVERGPGGRSTFQRPAALLEAQAQIAKMLAAEPDNPRWLAASGRAELLVWNYDAAIKLLERAKDYGDTSPDTLIDLASAYFQRAEAEPNRAVDYGRAIELLGRALKQRPSDSAALFNSAVIKEKMLLFSGAIKDLEALLLLRDGEWAREAKERLDALHTKLKKQASSTIPVIPDAALAVPFLTSRLLTPLPADTFDYLDEDYMQLALTSWLPKAFSGNASTPEFQAIDALSRVLERRHGDLWLAELLRNSSRARGKNGIHSLSQAIEANAENRFDEAAAAAGIASAEFRAARNPAGTARALRELVYSRLRAQEPRACLEALRELRVEIAGRAFAWIRQQIDFDQASCENMMGNPGRGQELLRSGIREGRKSTFGSIRILAYAAEGGYLFTDPRAWSALQAGLRHYWNGDERSRYGYQLYARMVLLAEESQWWHLAAEIARQNAAMLENTSESAYRAAAISSVASALRHQGHLRDSVRELERAQALIAALPRSPATTGLSLANEIEMAVTLSLQGETHAALRRLLRANPEQSDFSNARVLRSYYAAVGELHLREGSADQASAALTKALHLADAAVHSYQAASDRDRESENLLKVCRLFVELRFQEGGDETLNFWRACKRRSTEDAGPDPPRSLLAASSALSSPSTPRPGSLPIQVLSIAETKSGLALWLHRSGRVVAKTFVPEQPDTISRSARRFARLCADYHSSLNQIRESGRWLYQRLIAPVEDHLREDEILVLELDGALAQIPFSALWDGADYLGKRFVTRVSISPGSDWQSQTSVALPSRASLALVVGAPAIATEYARELPPLPDAAREAQLVSAFFPSARLLLGEAATSAAILRNLSRVEIFHFAGHALARADASALLTAPGGASDSSSHVTPELASRAGSRLRLVVLSACSTARGDGSPASPENLVRAFARSGRVEVVATRWNIDSQTTTAVVESFYREMLAGKSVGEALSLAAKTMRQSQLTQHPYYWAPFELYAR